MLHLAMMTQLLAAPLPLDVQEHHLDNGLQVLTVRRMSAPTVSVQLWVRTGSRDERPGITGIAHLFEHMMFKGSKKLGPEEHARKVQGLGGQLNAYTSNDMTVYFENIAAQHLDAILELEADRFQSLALSDTMLASEREVVKEERRMRTDNNPVGKLVEAFITTAYQTSNYRWPVIGYMEDLGKITLDDCSAFYKAHYNPKNVTVILVGALDHGDALAKVKTHFGAWPAQKRPARSYTAEPAPKKVRRKAVGFATQTPLLLGGWQIPAASDEDIPALQVLGQVLSGGMSSRLYRDLVYEKEMANYAAGDVWEFAGKGQFYLWASARPGVKIEAVEAAMIEAVEAVRAQGVTPEELDRARAQVERDAVYALKRASGIASLLGRSLIYHGDWRPALHSLDKLKAVQAADVQRVARRYLDPTVITSVHLLPEASP